jgi:hypothetical protein|tara:strand:- start:1393 stop:1791 length:399 start_codon:yes stop_codon:yes gene_type:complete
MKILKSIQHVPNPPVNVIQYPVKDIMLTAPLEWKWQQKRMPDFRESIEKTGMLWPVILVSLEHYWEPMKSKRWPRHHSGEFKKGVAVHTGNKRVIWAKEQGYDLIEAYLITDRNDKDEIVRQTYIAKHQWPK